MTAGTTTAIPAAKGSARRIPLWGWRGQARPGGGSTGRCPYCGQEPGPSSTAWCPGFDDLLRRAARALLAG